MPAPRPCTKAVPRTDLPWAVCERVLCKDDDECAWFRSNALMAVKSAVVYALLPDKTIPLCVPPIFTANTVPIREGSAVTVEISLQYVSQSQALDFREQLILVL